MSFDDFAFPLKLGFGCSGAWGMPWFEEARARAILLKALESGVRHVDTAGFYAAGEAESRLGAALKEFRDPVFVSTKTGTRYEKGRTRKDFGPEAIRADVEASLKRQGRERLDLLYLHGPSPAELERSLPVLTKLRDEGKIGLWGVCGQGRGLEEAVAAGADVIMGAYNFLRQEHAPAFARAKARGVRVVAIAPLAQGLYRRGFFQVTSAADAWRVARALVRNRQELARARAARPLLESASGLTPAQAALAFVHANADIDIALTSTTSLSRLAETLAGSGKPVQLSLLEALSSLDARGSRP